MREEQNAYYEQYYNRTHLYGKIGLSIGLVMMLSAPFLMGYFLNAMPDMKAFLTGFAQIAIVYIPSCFVEFMIYTPMLGAGGSYLGFTGSRALLNSLEDMEALNWMNDDWRSAAKILTTLGSTMLGGVAGAKLGETVTELKNKPTE